MNDQTLLDEEIDQQPYVRQVAEGSTYLLSLFSLVFSFSLVNVFSLNYGQNPSLSVLIFPAIMRPANPLNVYTGPNSLINYYDPDYQPFIPLVEIPIQLNPFHADGVRIYAKMMSVVPANNVKSLPGRNQHPRNWPESAQSLCLVIFRICC